MKNLAATPFPTVTKLADFCDCNWRGYGIAAKETEIAEKQLFKALSKISKKRLLDADSSMVVFGSFARYEMLKGSDCDWALLIDGVVNNQHTSQARELSSAIKSVFKEPGGTGTFGNMIFSHELVHCIGGSEAEGNHYFEKVRDKGSLFASGLRELFFNRESDKDPIANLSLDYVGF